MPNSFEILTSTHEIDEFLVLLIILKDQLAKTIIDNDYYNEHKDSFFTREKQYLADQNPKYYENFSYTDLFRASQLKVQHEEQYHQASNKLKEAENILNTSLKNLINVIFSIINKSIDDKIDVLDFIDKHREFDLGLLVSIIPITTSKIDSSNMGEQLSKKIVESFYENIHKIENIKSYRDRCLNEQQSNKKIKNKQLLELEKSIKDLSKKIYFDTDNKILFFLQEYEKFSDEPSEYQGKHKFIFDLFFTIILFVLLILFFYGCSQGLNSNPDFGWGQIIVLFVGLLFLGGILVKIPCFFVELLRLILFCNYKVKEYFRIQESTRVKKIRNTIEKNKYKIQLTLSEINNINEAYSYCNNPIFYINRFIKN